MIVAGALHPEQTSRLSNSNCHSLFSDYSFGKFKTIRVVTVVGPIPFIMYAYPGEKLLISHYSRRTTQLEKEEAYISSSTILLLLLVQISLEGIILLVYVRSTVIPSFLNPSSNVLNI